MEARQSGPTSSGAIDKLGFLEIQDRKVLMARSRGKDAWFFPGGKREASESDVDALKRELQEELGVELDGNSLVPVGVFEAQAYGKPHGVQVRIVFYRGMYTGTPTPGHEIEELAYLSSIDAEKLTDVGRLVFKRLQWEGLID